MIWWVVAIIVALVLGMAAGASSVADEPADEPAALVLTERFHDPEASIYAPTQDQFELALTTVLETGRLFMSCKMCGEELNADSHVIGATNGTAMAGVEASCPHCGSKEAFNLDPGESAAVAAYSRFAQFEMIQAMQDIAASADPPGRSPVDDDEDFLRDLDA